MTSTPLIELRGWLTIGETAEAIEALIGTKVLSADVYELALHGHLKLSVNLPPETVAEWRAYKEPLRPLPERCIDGLWRLPMVRPANLLIASLCAELRGLAPIPLEGEGGALIERPGVRARLRVENAAVIPFATQIVVSIPDMADFEASVTKPLTEKPLNASAEATLLTMIAALAEHRERIDISEHSSAGKKIDQLTTLRGVRVPGRTAEEYLKKIPNALKRRHQDSKRRREN